MNDPKWKDDSRFVNTEGGIEVDNSEAEGEPFDLTDTSDDESRDS